MSRCQADQRRPTPGPMPQLCLSAAAGVGESPWLPPRCASLPGQQQGSRGCEMWAAACMLWAGRADPPRGALTFFFSFFFSAFLFNRSSSATSSRAFLSASWGSDAVSTSAWHRATARRAGRSRVWATLPAPSHPPKEMGEEGLEDATGPRWGHRGEQKQAANRQPAGREGALTSAVSWCLQGAGSLCIFTWRALGGG